MHEKEEWIGEPVGKVRWKFTVRKAGRCAVVAVREVTDLGGGMYQWAPFSDPGPTLYREPCARFTAAVAERLAAQYRPAALEWTVKRRAVLEAAHVPEKCTACGGALRPVECVRCGGTGEEPGAPVEESGAVAQCSDCGGRRERIACAQCGALTGHACELDMDGFCEDATCPKSCAVEPAPKFDPTGGCAAMDAAAFAPADGCSWDD